METPYVKIIPERFPDRSLFGAAFQNAFQASYHQVDGSEFTTYMPAEQSAAGELPGVDLPYIYIDKVFNELRDELLTAMHAAIQSELRGGRVDVARLYRSFTRAAAKQMSNPVLISDKCMGSNATRTKKGVSPREED